MSFEIGFGFSKSTNPLEAAKNAAIQARQNLHQDRIDAALVFSTHHYNPHLFLDELYKDLSQTKLIGCSTEGIILPDSIEDKGIAVLTFFSNHIQFDIKHTASTNTNKSKIIKKQDLHHAGASIENFSLLFTNGLSNNTIPIINELCPSPSHFAGAKTGYKKKSETIYQYYNDKIMPNDSLSFSLNGYFTAAASLRHGWRPLGKPRFLSKTENHAIRTITKQPAKSIYEEFFSSGKQFNEDGIASISRRYPLGFPLGPHEEYLLRTIDEVIEDGSIFCQDTVPANSETHIMISRKESCLQAAQKAAAEVNQRLKGKRPKIVLVIESANRKKILGKELSQELQLIKKIFNKTPVVGMFSSGEILSKNHLNNKSEALVQNNSIIIIAIA